MLTKITVHLLPFLGCIQDGCLLYGSLDASASVSCCSSVYSIYPYVEDLHKPELCKRSSLQLVAKCCFWSCRWYSGGHWTPVHGSERPTSGGNWTNKANVSLLMLWAHSLSGLSCTVLLVVTLPCKHLSSSVIAVCCKQFSVPQFYLLHLYLPFHLCGAQDNCHRVHRLSTIHDHPLLDSGGGRSIWPYLGSEFNFLSLLLKIGGSSSGSCLVETSLGIICKPLGAFWKRIKRRKTNDSAFVCF